MVNSQSVTRLAFAMLGLAGAAALMAAPADAASSKRARGKAAAAVNINRVQGTQYYKAPSYTSDDSSTAIRARSLDPAGNYKDYPDWARAALAPSLRGGR